MMELNNNYNNVLLFLNINYYLYFYCLFIKI